MKLFRPSEWKPFFIENSRVPLFLEKFAPIKIAAITIGPLVFCRGKVNESNIRHETVHFQQQLETLFVGFLLLYIYDYLIALYIRKLTGRHAYLAIRAEVEARQSGWKPGYLKTRKRYRWILNFI